MTDLVRTRIRNVEVCRLSDSRAALVGTLTDVDQLIEGLRRAGQLVAASDPVRDGRPGMYAVTVRMLPPPAPVPVTLVAEPRRSRSRGPRFWAVVATGAGVALAGVAWAVVAIVQAALDTASHAMDAATGLAAVALPALLGFIVIIAAIVVIASAKGGGGFTFSGKGSMD